MLFNFPGVSSLCALVEDTSGESANGASLYAPLCLVPRDGSETAASNDQHDCFHGKRKGSIEGIDRELQRRMTSAIRTSSNVPMATASRPVRDVTKIETVLTDRMRARNSVGCLAFY